MRRPPPLRGDGVSRDPFVCKSPRAIMRALTRAIRWCPKCEQETMPPKDGRCLFCGARTERRRP